MHDGFVWVGTQGGLHRYDGQRYHLFRHDPRDPGSLPDSYVSALAVEGRDTLVDRHVFRIRCAARPARRAHPALRAAGDRRLRLARPARARAVADRRAGVDRHRRAARALRSGHGAHARPCSRWIRAPSRRRRSRRCCAIATARCGTASAAGLYRFGAGGSAERIAEGPVRSLAFDPTSACGSARADGLFRLRDDGRALLRVWPARGTDAGITDVRAIAEAPDHHLWFSAVRRRPAPLGPRGRRTSTRSANRCCADALPENTISELLLDRGGALWVGGQFRGASVTDPAGTRFATVVGAVPDDDIPGLAGNSVRALLEDDAGRWWFGTDGGGLFRTDAMGGHLSEAAGFRDALPAPRRDRICARWRSRRAATTGRGSRRRAACRSSTRARGMVTEVTLPGHPSPSSAQHGARPRRQRCGSARRRRGCCATTRATIRLRSYGNATEGTDPVTVHVDRRRPARPRVGRHQRRPATSSIPATGRMRVFRHVADAPDSLAGNLVRSMLQTADGTHLDRHARRPEPHARTRRWRSRSIIRSRRRSANARCRWSSRSPKRPGGVLWMGTDARPDALRSRARRRCAATASATACRTSNSTAAPRCACAMAACCSAACAASTCSIRAGVRDQRYMPPVRLLSARFGARRRVRRDDLAWQRDAAWTSRPTPACCACASARSTSCRRRTASAIATGSTGSTRTGSTTARSPK